MINFSFNLNFDFNAERERYQALYNSLSSDNHLIYVGTLLKRAAELWPDKTGLIENDQSITYKSLFERALRITDALQKKGIRPGNKVMLLHENSSTFYTAYFGAWQAGAVIVPVNTLLHAQQLARIIESAQPQALIISANLIDKAQELFSRIPVVLTSADLETIQSSTTPTTAQTPFLVCTQDSNALAALLYTSGTTGDPKGVMLSSRNIIINTIQGAARFRAEEHDKVLVALPLFHSYTQSMCIWLALFLGVPGIIVPKIERRALLAGLKHEPTIIIGIPQMYGLFCLMRTALFTKVRYFISGGDPLPDKIRLWFELLYRRKLCNGYGLTETAPFIAIDLDDVTEPSSTIGYPLIGLECQIRDEQNHVLPKDQKGILWVKGQNVMMGYYNAPQATAQVLQDGWFNTGDIAYFNTQGKLVLAGREKDLIKNKGIKIYPQELENLLMSHPEVAAVAVVGKQQDNEEVPVAFIAPRNLQIIKEPQELERLQESLKEFCKSQLAPYEVPRLFIIKESLPMTATGKIDKKSLKLALTTT